MKISPFADFKANGHRVDSKRVLRHVRNFNIVAKAYMCKRHPKYTGQINIVIIDEENHYLNL